MNVVKSPRFSYLGYSIHKPLAKIGSDVMSGMAAVAQTVELKFLHKSEITLCPGGTSEISRWRNHRIQSKTSSQPRRGDRQGLVCRPSGAGNRFLHRFRWLRCAPPPANIRPRLRRKNICRNLSWKVCATIATTMICFGPADSQSEFLLQEVSYLNSGDEP